MCIFSITASKREENLVCLLHELYPGDVGCFCVFFMNIVQLFNTHSIFLPANEPHCYLRGGCPSYYIVNYMCVQLKWNLKDILMYCGEEEWPGNQDVTQRNTIVLGVECGPYSFQL